MTQEEKIIKKAQNAYLRKICGFSYKEVKTTEEYDADGRLTKSKTETVSKRVLPDSNALLEYLRAKAPEKWGGAATADGTDCGVVILPEVESCE